jgi:chromosome segregation ATPase
MNRFMAVVVIGVMIAAIGAGCTARGSAGRAKREEDRLAMQLADAQRERDSSKTQLEALRKSLIEVTAQQHEAETQLAATRSELSAAREELTASRAAAASVPTLTADLKAAQQQVNESKIRIDALQQRINQLQFTANNAPATAPASQPGE